MALAGCGVYSFTGGGGLPGHVDSIAILPFENQTTQFTLTQELTQKLTDVLPGRLGVRLADERSADAVVRGQITRYNESAVNYQPDPGGPVVFQRRVDISVSVEIFDTTEEQVLWSSASLTASGEYLPDSQTEEVGRQLAIDNLINAIIDGAQSQW
ncbi:MAG: LptE family protein [Gemmatimonadetes bacterium]|uniref:LptE family protein n=1 Tax=Candidatus Kutchimonas denitrificans TaxID=3056748 RepID=A0AAE5CBE1_9BACT|nr:LptE family protein [Gemmatimonadota bacterium]NIR75737.1 LptE family protein [Candidatus Kutchimonas denitrificans]NIS00350.1 LptE family protein [Gemmatimonadota bacterium]NIT66009.1 LptE family protein [Gemmatimonadota bacterium]NIU53713.1 hypothetical protein [Gemmatimonadota bacterium]